MKSPALIAAAGLLAYGGYVLYTRSRTQQASSSTSDFSGSVFGNAEDLLTNAAEETAQFLDTVTLGTFSLSRMKNVTAADVRNGNVQAFLRVLRRGEGTADEAGYRRMFGGELFTSFADHPRKKITKNFAGSKITSSAAGAYQFLESTWDETRRLMGLGDFSPANQDLGAVGRIAARGALEDVKAGRFDTAIKKVAKEWASMPGSPYGQPVISLATARAVYTSAGGAIA